MPSPSQSSVAVPAATPPGLRGPAWQVALPAIALFLWLDHFHLDLFRALAGDWRGLPRVAALAVFAYLPQLLAALGLAALLWGPRAAPAALGLGHAPWRGLAVGTGVTLLLPLGFAVLLPFEPAAQWLPAVLRGAVLPGFGEELLYRGLLFGLLFRFARWGFLPAALLVAGLFGAAHLYQGNDAGQTAAIFALTALGSLWFAWLYVEWDFDLWVPIAVHVAMNAWWELFAVADDALGPLPTVLLRLAVIVLSVVVTVRVARRRGGRVVRGRAWLWGGPAPRREAGISPPAPR